MENQKKVTKHEMMKVLRSLLRKDIVGLSRVCGEGRMDFRLPNGQIFQITVDER